MRSAHLPVARRHARPGAGGGRCPLSPECHPLVREPRLVLAPGTGRVGHHPTHRLWRFMDPHGRLLAPSQSGWRYGAAFPHPPPPVVAAAAASRGAVTNHFAFFFINKKPIGGVRVAEIKRFVTHAHHETSDPRVCRSSHVTAACRVTRQSVSSPRSSGPARAVRGVL